jgi:hypothetical protein
MFVLTPKLTCCSTRALSARDFEVSSYRRRHIYIIVACVIALIIISGAIQRWRRSRVRRPPPSAAWIGSEQAPPNPAHPYAAPLRPPPTSYQNGFAPTSFSPPGSVYKGSPTIDTQAHMYPAPPVAYPPPAKFDPSSLPSPSHAAYPGAFQGGPGWPSPGGFVRPTEPEGARLSSIKAGGDDYGQTQRPPVPGGGSTAAPALGNTMTVGTNGEVVLSLAGSHPSQEKAHADQHRAFGSHNGAEAGPAPSGYMAQNPAVNRMPPPHGDAAPPAYEA